MPRIFQVPMGAGRVLEPGVIGKFGDDFVSLVVDFEETLDGIDDDFASERARDCPA